MIAWLDIHYSMLSFGIGVFNQENTFDTDRMVIYRFVVKPRFMCIKGPNNYYFRCTLCSALCSLTMKMRWSVSSLRWERGTWGTPLGVVIGLRGTCLRLHVFLVTLSTPRAVAYSLLTCLCWGIWLKISWQGQAGQGPSFPTQGAW